MIRPYRTPLPTPRYLCDLNKGYNHYSVQGCKEEIDMKEKQYQCHDCGDETKIIQSYDQTSNTYGFIIQCLNCGYEAGLFDTIEDAEMVIKCNSQGCNE